MGVTYKFKQLIPALGRGTQDTLPTVTLAKSYISFNRPLIFEYKLDKSRFVEIFFDEHIKALAFKFHPEKVQNSYILQIHNKTKSADAFATRSCAVAGVVKTFTVRYGDSVLGKYTIKENKIHSLGEYLYIELTEEGKIYKPNNIIHTNETTKDRSSKS